VQYKVVTYSRNTAGRAPDHSRYWFGGGAVLVISVLGPWRRPLASGVRASRRHDLSAKSATLTGPALAVAFKSLPGGKAHRLLLATSPTRTGKLATGWQHTTPHRPQNTRGPNRRDWGVLGGQRHGLQPATNAAALS
jgi:hypothetical protein